MSMLRPLTREPLITVLLPTRNRADLLPRAIRSVLTQTYRNLELLVIDDASTDHTADVLESIHDSRMRVIRREINKGAAAARNAGIAQAKGELIAFQDDDDYWLTQKLEKQLISMQSAPPDTAWCLSAYLRVQKQTCKLIDGADYMGGTVGQKLRFELGNRGDNEGPDWSLIATPGWLIRRELLHQTGGFDERMRSYDDWELSLRLAALSEPAILHEPLWVQDWDAGRGMMGDEYGRAKDMRHIMEKHGEIWAGHPHVLARHFYIIGRTESLYEPAPAGRAELWRALRFCPWRVKTLAALLLAYVDRRAVRVATRLIRNRRQAANLFAK